MRSTPASCSVLFDFLFALTVQVCRFVRWAHRPIQLRPGEPRAARGVAGRRWRGLRPVPVCPREHRSAMRWKRRPIFVRDTESPAAVRCRNRRQDSSSNNEELHSSSRDPSKRFRHPPGAATLFRTSGRLDKLCFVSSFPKRVCSGSILSSATSPRS